MTNAYRLTLTTLFFALMVASCKKATENAGAGGEYYIKFNFDGVAKTLKNGHGGLTNTSGVCSGGLYARSADTVKESNILLLDSLPFTTGKTYKCILVKANKINDVPQTLLTYYDEHNVHYGATYVGYDPPPQPAEYINLKFSEITSTYLRGTFDAAVVLTPYHTSYPVHQITNGEFYLKRTY